MLQVQADTFGSTEKPVYNGHSVQAGTFGSTEKPVYNGHSVISTTRTSIGHNKQTTMTTTDRFHCVYSVFNSIAAWSEEKYHI